MTRNERPPSGIRETVQRALEALVAGQREQCAVILYRHAYAFIVHRLMHGAPRYDAPGLSEEDAEDLVFPLIDRFTRIELKGGTGAGLALLLRVIDNALVDAHRRRLAQKRGGEAKITSMHDDEGAVTPEAEAAGSLWGESGEGASLGLDDCMERATEEFEKDRPTYARLLRLLRQDLEDDEVVAYFAEDPANITVQDRNRFKSRKSTALKLAREYFEPCKEMIDD